MTLTRKDLEEHESRLSEANDRVVYVLKDVAVQFNTIATQLLSLSRTTEAIVDSQHNSVDRIETRVRNQVDLMVKHQKEQRAHSAELMKVEVTKVHGAIDSCSKSISDVTQAIKENQAAITSSLASNRESIKSLEKESIKSQVRFAMIIGVIVGILQVASILLNLWVRPATPTPSAVTSHVPAKAAQKSPPAKP